MSTYKLKPEVVEAFAKLPEHALKALEALLEGVQGKDEYIDEIGDDYGSYTADEGLTDWDIDISERGSSLVSSLSDLWDECKFCGQDIKMVWGKDIETRWEGDKPCTATAHEPEEEGIDTLNNQA